MTLTNNAILNVFQGFRMDPTPLDQFEAVGREILDNKISKFTDNNRPIEFSMLGFPFKSINSRDKVLGVLPDLGEQLTLDNFGSFGEQIRAVYSPGIKLHMVSDGYVFNDLMDVPDSTVQSYHEMSMDMSKTGPVEWHDVFDFYGKAISVATAREKIVNQFGITDTELERRILMDPDVNFLYKGMIRFMEGDLAIRSYDSKNQLHVAAKRMARQMMFRNEAYSKLVQTEMSDKIRLSMHPSLNNGNKYSFQLIPSPKAFASPWHCAILKLKDGSVATIHRKDAEVAGHELVHVGGRPYYFNEN